MSCVGFVAAGEIVAQRIGGVIQSYPAHKIELLTVAACSAVQRNTDACTGISRIYRALVSEMVLSQEVSGGAINCTR